MAFRVNKDLEKLARSLVDHFGTPAIGGFRAGGTPQWSNLFGRGGIPRSGDKLKSLVDLSKEIGSQGRSLGNNVKRITGRGSELTPADQAGMIRNSMEAQIKGNLGKPGGFSLENMLRILREGIGN